MSATEKHHFQAEIQQLLNIVVHSLYTDKEIFVRELISNAADACEKLRFTQSAGKAVYQPEIGPGISINTDDKAQTITFTDTGIGMTRDELNGKRLNTVQAIWARNKNEIKEEEYNEFYQYVGHDHEGPMYRLHFSADAPLAIQALLFVPQRNFETLGMGRQESEVNLYCKK